MILVHTILKMVVNTLVLMIDDAEDDVDGGDSKVKTKTLNYHSNGFNRFRRNDGHQSSYRSSHRNPSSKP